MVLWAVNRVERPKSDDVDSVWSVQDVTGDKELFSVYVPTNHIYVGDIFLLEKHDIIRPNLSVREGLGEKAWPLPPPFPSRRGFARQSLFPAQTTSAHALHCRLHSCVNWHASWKFWQFCFIRAIVCQASSEKLVRSCVLDRSEPLIDGWTCVQKLWSLWVWRCRST